MEDQGIDGRIILKLILKKWDGGEGIDWINLAQDRDKRHGNEPVGSIKCGEFLKLLWTC